MPAEQLFVGVQRPRTQPPDDTLALHLVDEIAHVRRAEHGRRDVVDGVKRRLQERPSGNDVDLDAHAPERANPREMLRLAAAAHHGEASHEVGDPHRVIVPSPGVGSNADGVSQPSRSRSSSTTASATRAPEFPSRNWHCSSDDLSPARPRRATDRRDTGRPTRSSGPVCPPRGRRYGA